jgi:hypothetical protein
MIRILFFVVSISANIFSQIYYHSDYLPCDHLKGEKTTIKEFCEMHKISMDTIYTPPGAMDRQFNAVYFVLFTNKPAFAIIRNGTGEEMKEIVDNFNIDNFLFSSALETELDRIIINKSKIASSEWIKRKLGNPSKIKCHITLLIIHYVIIFIQTFLSDYIIKEYISELIVISLNQTIIIRNMSEFINNSRQRVDKLKELILNLHQGIDR